MCVYSINKWGGGGDLFAEQESNGGCAVITTSTNQYALTFSSPPTSVAAATVDVQNRKLWRKKEFIEKVETHPILILKRAMYFEYLPQVM
jgi:hypothetical protein